MSALASPAAPTGLAHPRKAVLGLALAAAIAWFAPFDLAFAAATFDVPALRSALIVALALIGWTFSRRVGLSVETVALKRPLLTPLIIAGATAVWCALADVLMRGALHPNYLQSMTTAPLLARVIGYMMRAFNENIIYRLFLSSVLAWLIGRAWKAPDGRPAVGAFWTAFVLAQAANIWINVTALAPITPFSLLHDVLRYVAPGLVWSWLYWRHGFTSNEIASTSVHLVFQPLASLGLS